MADTSQYVTALYNGQPTTFTSAAVAQQYGATNIQPLASATPPPISTSGNPSATEVQQALTNPGSTYTPPASTVSSVQVPSGNIDLSRGDQFFVQFPDSHGATIYLYDKNRKIFVPFTSEAGFDAFAGKTTAQAGANHEIYVMNSSVIPQMGTVVSDQYGFNDQGQVSNPAYFSGLPDTTGLAGHYGLASNPTSEKNAATKLWTFAQYLVNNKVINQATFDKYVSDPTQFAIYINAAAYGGYSAADILRDLKAKDLGLTNIKTFDTTQPATQFYQTPEHALSANNAQLALPANLNLDPGLLNNPVFNIPDAAFQTLVPVLDKNSQSYKDQVKAVQDTYHDLLLQQLDATTAEQKAIADTNYKQFQDQLKQKFGITLSDNATTAWNQIQNIETSGVNTNMLNSGVFNEAIDKAIATVQKTNARARTDEQTQAMSEKQRYYTTQATPDQIKNDLTPQERQAWGLTATSETMNFINNLKTTYPGITDEQVKQIRDSLIDENGNNRSTLYANLFQNRLTQTQAKTTLQEQTVQAQNDIANQKAYTPYTPTDNPFIRDTSTPDLGAPTTPPATTNPYSYTGNAPGTPSSTPAPTTNNPAAGSTTPGITTPGINDLSSKYGLHNGTVYDLSTGLGYSTPDQFFSAAGINSFNNIKLNTDYAPSFYKYNSAYQGNPAATVYSGLTNKPLDYNSYIQSGGTTDFSGVSVKQLPGSSTPTPTNTSSPTIKSSTNTSYLPPNPLGLPGQ